MRSIQVVAIVSIVVVVALGAVLLHDVRRQEFQADAEAQIAEKRLVIPRLRDALAMLQEYVASEEPSETQFYRHLRERNPDLDDEHFKLWFAQNRVRIDTGVKTDLIGVPTAIERHQDQLKQIKDEARQAGRPWLLGG